MAPALLSMVTRPAAPAKTASVPPQGALVTPLASVQLLVPIFQVPAPPSTWPVGAMVTPFQNWIGLPAP